MSLGIQRLHQRFVCQAVRTIVVALPALVLHHVALTVKLLLRDRFEEPAHTIRFQMQRKLERTDRQRLPVVRAIGRGRAVVRATRIFEQLIELALGHVLRAFKHQMLEQMREARAAGALVLGADKVPEIDANDRRAMVLVDEQREPVRELVGFMRNVQLHHLPPSSAVAIKSTLSRSTYRQRLRDWSIGVFAGARKGVMPARRASSSTRSM